MNTDISGITQPALFLSETELQTQGNRYAWRKGVTASVNNLFRAPRDTPEFPRVFQNTGKRVDTKPLPFTFKAFQRQVKTEEPVRPTITIPDNTEEPSYAPKTP